MQKQRQIARAFTAWQSAHQRFSEAETRLAAATLAFKQGLAPSPDALRQELLVLKAEREWRYDEAAECLRRSRTGSGSPATQRA